MTFETTYKSDNESLLVQLGVYEQYHPIVMEAAKKYVLSWEVIAGLGSRESHWGLALKPKGPGGTGDFTARHCVGRVELFRSDIHPPDSKGYGRGLFQIDFDWHEFARSGNWQDPRENIFYGCKVLADSINTIKRRCTTIDGSIAIKGFDPGMILRYGLAAYNAGPLAVLTVIREGKEIDSCTTGKDYSADVLSRAGWFRERLIHEYA